MRRERYDVDLVLTTFGGSLYDSMKLMQTTDLFLGMHGAGFTNVLFLPPVRRSVGLPSALEHTQGGLRASRASASV